MSAYFLFCAVFAAWATLHLIANEYRRQMQEMTHRLDARFKAEAAAE